MPVPVADPQVHRVDPPAATPVDVTIAAPTDQGAWDAFVTSRSEASGYHEWAWRRVFEDVFGHQCVYLVARRDGDVVGVLPLVEMRSVLFGHFLTSLPFVNYGGVLAAARDVTDALLESARTLGVSRKCRHVELRHVDRCGPDLPVRQHKVTMHLDLSPGMWERFDRKVRNQIRKAEKSQLVAVRGGRELLPEFYAVFARNMRDLGTPVYSRRLFETVCETAGDRARVIVVRNGQAPVAGGLTYRTGATTEVPWASSLREFNSLCPNHLLYWRAIEWALADGCTRLDFGRSTPNEGTYQFKSQWGARPVPLHWEYPYLADSGVPDQGPTNPRFSMAITMWKRCPLWLANALGPHLVRAIP